MKARPATMRTYAKAPESYSKERANLSTEERNILFGQTAAQR